MVKESRKKKKIKNGGKRYQREELNDVCLQEIMDRSNSAGGGGGGLSWADQWDYNPEPPPPMQQQIPDDDDKKKVKEDKNKAKKKSFKQWVKNLCQKKSNK